MFVLFPYSKACHQYVLLRYFSCKRPVNALFIHSEAQSAAALIK